MKNGAQFSSFYDHIVYPVSLYGSVCSGGKCEEAGMITTFDAATVRKHLRSNQDTWGIKEKFKV